MKPKYFFPLPASTSIFGKEILPILPVSLCPGDSSRTGLWGASTEFPFYQETPRFTRYKAGRTDHPSTMNLQPSLKRQRAVKPRMEREIQTYKSLGREPIRQLIFQFEAGQVVKMHLDLCHGRACCRLVCPSCWSLTKALTVFCQSTMRFVFFQMFVATDLVRAVQGKLTGP